MILGTSPAPLPTQMLPAIAVPATALPLEIRGSPVCCQLSNAMFVCRLVLLMHVHASDLTVDQEWPTAKHSQ